MSEKNPYRVFVTHAFSETDDYLRVFEFLESVERFFYLNVSKPEIIEDGGTLEDKKDELISQIKSSEVVVVVNDVWEQDQKLVEYMLDVAEANDVNAVAIQPFGGVSETPPELGWELLEVPRDRVEPLEDPGVPAHSAHGAGDLPGELCAQEHEDQGQAGGGPGDARAEALTVA